MNMVQNNGLSEMDTVRDYFTWSNKRVGGAIDSIIDRVLANVNWLQQNMETTLNIMKPWVYV